MNEHIINTTIIIILILLLIVIIILFILMHIYYPYNKNNNIEKEICDFGFYFSKKDNNCKKCTIDNWQICYDNNISDICFSCNSSFTPIYENKIIKSCEYIFKPEEEDNCLAFDIFMKNCINCSPGYKLKDGKCILNYSLKAIYTTKKKWKY